MSRVLEARAVSFVYEKERPLFSDVDAELCTGLLTGIVGPNGCGKSTLLRLLCGLLCPDSGQVTLDQVSLHRFSSRYRARQIAFLPQAVNPAFSMTAFEVVCLGRYPHAGPFGGLRPDDFEAARRCLRHTGAETLAQRDFMALSGGERQRVLLASILAQEPKMLLLDEPTSALDIHHRAEVFALLQSLAAQGYGVGVVTHDLNLAAQYCQHLILLGANHRVAASGHPESVLSGEVLSEAYAAPIQVGRHPFSDAPFVDVARNVRGGAA